MRPNNARRCLARGLALPADVQEGGATAVKAAPGVCPRLGREDTFRLPNRLFEIQEKHAFISLPRSLTQTGAKEKP